MARSGCAPTHASTPSVNDGRDRMRDVVFTRSSGWIPTVIHEAGSDPQYHVEYSLVDVRRFRG